MELNRPLATITPTLDGDVLAALAQHDATKLLPLIKPLVNKLGEYGSKTTYLFAELEAQLSYGDFADLQLGASMIAHALDRLENATAGDLYTTGDNDPLITMQKGIRLARTRTRELIDERTLNS